MLPIPEITKQIERRFWLKIDRKSDSECWNWIGAISDGYGEMSIYGQNYKAHRLSYYICYKKDPGEFLVCHLCNNSCCMNPNHLFLGTNAENIQHAFDTGIRNNQGILNPRTRLLESHILEIRELQGTIKQSEIAQLFNVSETTISRLLSGKTWSHVKGGV